MRNSSIPFALPRPQEQRGETFETQGATGAASDGCVSGRPILEKGMGKMRPSASLSPNRGPSRDIQPQKLGGIPTIDLVSDFVREIQRFKKLELGDLLTWH